MLEQAQPIKNRFTLSFKLVTLSHKKRFKYLYLLLFLHFFFCLYFLSYFFLLFLYFWSYVLFPSVIFTTSTSKQILKIQSNLIEG